MPEFLHLNSGIENNMPKEIKTGHTDNGPEKKLTPFFISVPVKRQAHFTMVALFHESVEFVRDYTLPFNLLSVCIRSDGKNASVMRNLKTKEEYTSEPGLITLCPCNLPQRYSHTLRDEHIAIHFKLELFPGVDVYSGQQHVFPERSLEMMHEAMAIFNSGDPVLQLSRSQEFALRFCHRHWPEHYAFEIKEMQRFSDVLYFVREQADASTTAAELASLMHLPESAFFREFRTVFNISPKQFLQQEIFNKAAQLLLMPEMSVKLTATRLNFSSEFYFSHFFKRLSGVSPKKYRETHLFSAQ